MISEKRKYIRSRVKDDAYAALGNHFTRVGKLKDISIDGLAFRYIGNTEDWVEDSSTIAIFDSENTFYLPNLACKLIYVSPLYVIKNIRYFKTAKSINRCGVQFTALTDYQLEKLELFINNYTRRLELPQKVLNVPP